MMPDMTQKLYVEVDASDHGLGAASKKNYKCFDFVSRVLHNVEKRYF